MITAGRLAIVDLAESGSAKSHPVFSARSSFGYRQSEIGNS